LTPELFRASALEVLHKNDLGGWTKPAPRLYPHQWSWDSAFIAIGLAHVDLDRALRELEMLFGAQWSDGRVPHIVFNPTAQDYFPGADWWASAATSDAAPREPATSGLIQPPVHAFALEHILSMAPASDPITARIAALYPRVLSWHRYLAHFRDPHQTGLLVIYHPWESGTDNSPRWDAALQRIEVGVLPRYQRHDLKHVEDPSERPTHFEYDRYLWLVHLLKRARYSDPVIQQDFPFQIRDVLMSAIFAAANESLAEVARQLGRPGAEINELHGLCERFNRGVARAWDADLQLALDWDAVTSEPVRVQTCAGLAPLLLPNLSDDLRDSVVSRLTGAGFAGADGLAYAVVPSTSPHSAGFNARSYWRGPSWPHANWLYWRGLGRHGFHREAAALRAANLALLEHPQAEFAEYFDPYTAEPLGSREQSWTAAVAIDWLAHESS
jgi:glucosylglycerate hydrolase